MIKKLKINNFKSIKSIELELSNFCLLCGENASGKTSVIHSLLAIIQKNDTSNTLDGEILKIGDFTEIRNRDVPASTGIEIEISDGIKNKFLKYKAIKVPRRKFSKDVLVVTPARRKQLSIDFENGLFYLSSNRIGVVDTYGKGQYKFGTDGLSFAEFIVDKKDVLMPDRYKDKVPLLTGEIHSFGNHIKHWFKKITSEEIRIQQVAYTNQFVLTFGDNNTRAINTGSGLSYVLPIIAVCLGSLLLSERTSLQPTIIIENPEIFLHPTAQNELTEFLLLMSECSQIIVETHSDHILRKIIEENRVENKVFVFNLDNGETKCQELGNGHFKIIPTSYAEVQYRAFNLVSIDLHIILYGRLHESFKGDDDIANERGTILSFDAHLSTIIQSDNLLKEYSHENRIYKTLPTYIRNCIHHPDNSRSFTELELKDSIDFLVGLL